MVIFCLLFQMVNYTHNARSTALQVLCAGGRDSVSSVSRTGVIIQNTSIISNQENMPRGQNQGSAPNYRNSNWELCIKHKEREKKTEGVTLEINTYTKNTKTKINNRMREDTRL